MQNTRPMTDYTNKVRRLADNRAGEPVYNESLEHAVVILQNMFSHARKSICILTGRLNEDAYGDPGVVKEARRFLESPDRRIRILFEDEYLKDVAHHPFLAIETGQKKIEKYFVPEKLQNNYKFHFIVMDEDSYRFEPDRKEYKAVAAFGDAQGGQNLGRLFEQLWEAATREA